LRAARVDDAGFGYSLNLLHARRSDGRTKDKECCSLSKDKECCSLSMREGVVTLTEIGPIWTVNQRAKSLKFLASTLAVVGKFRSF
jgi:hypothetical protein